MDVSLSVPPGRLVVLIGRSGCDRSALLRAVADLLPITSGAVRPYMAWSDRVFAGARCPGCGSARLHCN